MRRVLVTYRGADAAHFAERLYFDLATQLRGTIVVAGEDPWLGDIVVVVIADGAGPAQEQRLAELPAAVLQEAVLRDEDVVTVRVVRGARRAGGWCLNLGDWDVDVRRLGTRLEHLLERGAASPPRLPSASDPDLLGWLLRAEAGGTVTRRRAGQTIPGRFRTGPRPQWYPPVDADEADDIDVTVFSPVHTAPGDALLVQVFAHLPAQAADTRALATEFDADARASGFTSLSLLVAVGATLGFELRVPGLQIDEGGQTLVWRGRPQSVQFGVTVPQSARPGTRIATLIVSLDSVPVGHVKFKLTVSANARVSRADLVAAGQDARPYDRAFVSYAREDWSEVLRRVQVLRLKRLTRLQLFQDIIDIDPGERWNQRLYVEIDDCDVVLLFWSTAAHDSEWVRREIQYALGRRVTEFDPPEIVPVIIEVPPRAPWPELAHQHFDDAIARLITD